MKRNDMDTDAEWEQWGKTDPYFGVLTDEKFRRENLTDEARREFFESGRRHINLVLEVCRRHFDQRFSPKQVLDFGCGVGRLVIPLAEIADHVVGLDVSASMLQEARKNCDEYSVRNVRLLQSDDNLSALAGKFDLIHSFVTLQHIPAERGRRIFANLLNHLKEGGICALQVTYSKAAFRENHGLPHGEVLVTLPLMQKVKRKARRLVGAVVRAVRRRISSQATAESVRRDPDMQMNPYHLNELFFLMQSAGVHETYVSFTDHGGELGVHLYFQKCGRV